MDFLKIRKIRRAHKPNPEKDTEDKPVPNPVEPKAENNAGLDDLTKSSSNPVTDDIEDDDEDFITNEVKRRLKELRRNSFMVLIPEEEEEMYMEEEEEDEKEEEDGEGVIGPNEWRDVEAEGRQWWGGFDAVYDKYCERMLFFDKLSSLQLKETGILQVVSTPSPKSGTRKLSSPFRCLSLKKLEEPEEQETEYLQLQQQQPGSDPFQDLETAYVAQVSLTWEALHCQYTQLSHLISCQPDNPKCYNVSAEQFQQFQVLLQRFIENEPFETGSRAEVYARTRSSMHKLLQVPKIQGSDRKDLGEKDSDFMVLTHDLIKIIQNAILTLYIFLKMDKKKPNGVIGLFGNQNQIATPLQQVQSSLEKKRMKLKDLQKKAKGWKNKSWPQTQEIVHLLFALIDVKIISRVLRMVKISKDQLFWCEEKMKKLKLSDGKLLRDPTPVLFPC